MADDDAAEGLGEGYEGVGPDPAAMGIAFNAAQANAGVAAEAQAYLKEQTRLARAQFARLAVEEKHFPEEERLKLSHLRMRRFGDYSKMLFELGAGLTLLAVVFGFGTMVWNATQDHDLVIDAFTVPPDFAARGLTGQVVAAELLDQFGQMEAITLPTAQSEGTHRLDAGDTIRVEIPEAGGLSLTEVDRFLKRTLGQETHVSGEVVRTASGLAITLRADAKPGVRIDGREADFDGLIERAAENLFAQTEPLRHADYLADTNRFADAVAALRVLSLAGSPLDRARALTSWAEAVDFSGDGRDALPIAKQAIDLVPNASFAWAVVSDADMELGHEEAGHTAEVAMVRTAPETWSARELQSAGFGYLPWYIAQRRDSHVGDFAAAEYDWTRLFLAGGTGIADNDAASGVFEQAPQHAQAHDLAAARRFVASAAPVIRETFAVSPAYAGAIMAFYADDWRSAVTNAAALEASPKLKRYALAWERVQVRPLYAIALARLGDYTAADALIAKTPEDCDLCARARGTIAALKHDWPTAERWYALVAARSPSIPFADTDWGQMLLWKGDPDGAIAKLTAAHGIGPHFADPLALWGEALMQKNRSDLALAKFAEADKYAPQWGRLHLEWGKALLWSGDRTGAKKQFAVAADLDLSASDKAALAKWTQRN